jgi:SAM-dependent methyltransferase
VIYKGHDKFKKRLGVLLERFYLKLMLHSIESLLKREQKSRDMDRAFLNVAQRSLSYLLERVRQASANDLEQLIQGLYTTNIDLIYATVELYSELDEAGAREVGREILSTQLPPEDRFLIPHLQPREKAVLNTWSYQNEVMEWDIKPRELVLDVGSGGWPFSKATHLADMFVGETTHRYERLRQDERPFFVIDVCRMPFGDKRWDFTFCSHVLEHLDRPGDAIRELSRVSRRGYIEVPTRLSDVMLNFTRLKNHHRWHGLVLDDILVLIEWQEEERRDLGSNYFFECLQSRYHNEFQDLFEKNWDLFYSMVKWEDSIKFLIISNDGRIIDRSNNG